MFRVITILFLCFVLTEAMMTPPRKTYPEKLSGWKLFTGRMNELKPASHVVPYQLNTPLFTDYAEKLRFVRMPAGKKARYTEKGILEFPTGTVLVKNFYYAADMRKPGINKQIIETRLLVKEEEGWNALTYVWDKNQADAVREIAGDDLAIHFIDKEGIPQNIRYVIPNQNQCKGCHNRNDQILPIGPEAAQLNGKYAYPSGSRNQLQYWKAHGMLDAMPALSAVPKLTVWNDPASGTLDERARAYLAINCAHCHRREGPAQTSGLFLTLDEKNPTATGIRKAPVAAGKGSGGRMVDIEPGHAEASILWYRMQVNDPGERMPELGRSVVHKEGLALIRDWINQMKP